MNLNRMLCRALSIGMVGTMVMATPVYAAEGSNNGIAGIAELFQTRSADAQAIVGVAAVSYKNEAYVNAMNVLAENENETEMTEEEKAAQVALAEEIKAVAEEQKKESPYAKVAISQVNNYVNIRNGASEDAEVVGKIYNNAAATILDTVEAEDGTWYQITSGSVEGYIKSNYFVTGEEAEAIAYEVGYVTATVSTESLRLRSAASTDSSTLTLLDEDEKYEVVTQDGEFTELCIDDDLYGYVATDYVTIHVDFKQAISLEEERAAEEARRLAEESKAAAEREEAERLAREAAEAEDTEYEEEYEEEDTEYEEEYEEEDTEYEEEYEEEDTEYEEEYEEEDTEYEEEYEEEDTEYEEEYEEEEEEDTSSYSSSERQAIVDYACSFVGNLRYVWGGTSLSSGVDCSGFVQQVFKHFGYSLPRTSASQGSAGFGVSSSSMQPGDIVYYGGHIAIYIGDGKVVHASNAKTGVKISTWNYRTPLAIRNVID